MGAGLGEILGRRLKKAREDMSLTLEEVAKKVGFNNYQTLSSIEDGTRQIKAHELSALAKIYFKDINYFLNPTNLSTEISLVLWRDSIPIKKIKISREQEFMKYCHNFFELEEAFGLNHNAALPDFNLAASDFSYAKCEEIALNYYNVMQLGSRPACCLEKILEQKYNIKILFLDLKIYGSAACSVGDFGSAILINSSEPPWRRNYDLAHELFHLITWKKFSNENFDLSCDRFSPIEKWANSFASTLLLPAEEVKKELEKRIEDNEIDSVDLIEVAREFSVSTEALLWRLVSLKYAKQQDVQKFLDEPQLRELDKIARLGDRRETPYISERYLNLAFKAYQKGLISKGKLAEYLGIEKSEVDSKLSELGYADGEVYNGTLTIA